uniref:Uncharacterized protein n=1 Tax=Oryza barthii TaxID=65489 RepID=A0A0D3FUV1_9ORYZ
MAEPTVRDVLAFHRVDRAAYDQLLSLGVPPPPARNAVALLMWLGRRGGGASVDAVDRARRLRTRRWGDCLEKVMMERTPAGEPPTYGRIVFRHAAVAAAVLGGEHLVKLVINGRQLRARKYFPRKSFSHGLN